MARDVLILSKLICDSGEVEETPLDEGNLGPREVVVGKGVVEVSLDRQSKWVVCYR